MERQQASARWIDLGRAAPIEFHAAYQGLAWAMGEASTPAVVWARVAPHLCLGQSQGLCDAAAELDVTVLRRALGGGAVWVDEDQYCYALVVPQACAPHERSAWFAWALEPARRTLNAFGLKAEIRDSDLWLGGRKIAGSGAATLGRCLVIGSSFLMRFPHARFAAALALPDEGWRPLLAEGLARAMTDWASHAPPPDGDRLAQEFRRHLGDALGWNCQASSVGGAEAREIDAAREELSEPIEWGRPRRVEGQGMGIKLNCDLYLTDAGQGPRLVTAGDMKAGRRPAGENEG